MEVEDSLLRLQKPSTGKNESSVHSDMQFFVDKCECLSSSVTTKWIITARKILGSGKPFNYTGD